MITAHGRVRRRVQPSPPPPFFYPSTDDLLCHRRDLRSPVSRSAWAEVAPVTERIATGCRPQRSGRDLTVGWLPHDRSLPDRRGLYARLLMRSSAMSTSMSSWPPTMPRRPASSSRLRASTSKRAAAASAWRKKLEYTPA